MPGRERRRRHVALAGVVALSLTTCGCQTTSRAASGSHTGRRFTATATDGSRVLVPGKRPVVMDFVSAGCDTGLSTLAQAKTADPGADYVAVDIDPGATVAQIRQILSAAGAGGLATASDPNGGLTAAYRIQTIGTTVVQAPTGAVVYTGIDPSRAQIAKALAKAAS